MAFEEYDDYEQEQMVKEWLNNNWLTIIAGIAIGIGGLWGYGKYQDSQVTKSTEAASAYVQLAASLEVSEPGALAELINGYEADYGTNVYSIEARMTAAKKLMEADDISAAKTQYQALINSKPDKPIAEMARLRLARLLVSEGDYAAAKTELGLVQSQAYQTIVEEVMGDIYAAEGDSDKARDAYQLALNEGEGYSGKQIVEMKLADIKTIN